MTPDFAATHDHSYCVAQALDDAEALCEQQGKRLTPLRKRVLELVWLDHKPVNAYDILRVLAQEGWGSSPPVAYRALAFLTNLGVVHRLERLNAFVGCVNAKNPHLAEFFICTDCGEVTETVNADVANGLRRAANDIGFSVSHSVVEIEGRCRNCQPKLAAEMHP